MFRQSSARFVSRSKLGWIAKLHYGWKDAPIIGSPFRLMKVTSPSAPADATDGKVTASLPGIDAEGNYPRLSPPVPAPCGSADERDPCPAGCVDSAVYCRALIYASSGCRSTRDWIAGFMALLTQSPDLIELPLQYNATKEDVLALKKAIHDCVPEQADREEIALCFFYDACRAAVANPTYSHVNRRRLLETADTLGLDVGTANSIESLVLEEGQVLDIKRKLLQEDSPVSGH